jgi:VanZ family protein
MQIFTAQASMPKWIRFWPFVTVTVAIFWLSVIKTPSLKLYENWFWDNIDKLGHAFAYAALYFSGAYSLKSFSDKKLLNYSKLKVLFVFCFLYGFLIEILQYFLPHRSFDPFDMLANTLGICSGLVFFARLYPKAFVS